MVLAEVFAQYIPAKITGEVAPCRMDVIGTVLCVGVFKQETWALDSIIVWLKLLSASSPGEMDFAQAAFFNLVPVFFCDNSAMSINIFFYEGGEQRLLFLFELVECNPGQVECLHLGQRGGEDIAWRLIGDGRLSGLGTV